MLPIDATQDESDALRHLEEAGARSVASAVPLWELKDCSDSEWAIIGSCMDLAAQEKIHIDIAGIYLR